MQAVKYFPWKQQLMGSNPDSDNTDPVHPDESNMV